MDDEAKLEIKLSSLRDALEEKIRIDPDFRCALNSNANHAFKALTGLELPSDVKIKVIDDHVYLEVPEETIRSEDSVTVELDAWRLVVVEAPGKDSS